MPFFSTDIIIYVDFMKSSFVWGGGGGVMSHGIRGPDSIAELAPEEAHPNSPDATLDSCLHVAVWPGLDSAQRLTWYSVPQPSR